MGYVKVVKNKSFYKRYKVKLRRRRQCKTDYALRRRLIAQDKRKYNAPKWRFVVRITNATVICQIASSKIIGDQILCSAYSSELKKYGLKVGLTNYAACYCTGLLIARRLLKKLQLDKYYPGKKKLDGNKFLSHVANVRWKAGEKIYRPFKCLLDIGLARATTGARVFGVLKGAVDGGLDIPHSPNRFPGFEKGKRKQDDKYKSNVHRDKIYGGHVRDYMTKLQKKDPEKYQRHFSQFIAEGITADKLENLYMGVHKAIRLNPSPSPKKKRDFKKMELKFKKQKKLTYQQRVDNRKKKIEEMLRKSENNANAQTQ